MKAETLSCSRGHFAKPALDPARGTLERREAGRRCKAGRPPLTARQERACQCWGGRRRRQAATRQRRGRWGRSRSLARSSSTRSSRPLACPSGCPAAPLNKRGARAGKQGGHWQELAGWHRGPCWRLRTSWIGLRSTRASRRGDSHSQEGFLSRELLVFVPRIAALRSS